MRRRSGRAPVGADGKAAKCHWCQRQLEGPASRSSVRATADHVIPRAKGGRYAVWACFTCNNLKGEMFPDEWRAYMESHPGWWRRRWIAASDTVEPRA